MKKTQEIITTTAQEIESVALTQEQIEAREGAINRYNRAVANVEGSAWNFARTVYSIVHDEEFKTLFGNIKTFALEVGTSEGTISKLNKVYARKLSLGQRDEDEGAFTTGQLMEFGSIPVEESILFIAEKDVTNTDTIKAIRKKAKEYIEEHKETKDADEVVEAQTEGTGEDETEGTGEDEKKTDTLVIEFNGELTQIFDHEKIARIMAIVNE